MSLKAQQSVPIYFPFTACFTWCRTHFLVVWLANNSLIALPASLQRKFVSVFTDNCVFASSHIFVLLCMYMFWSPCFVLFCHHSIPVFSRRLSRAILPHCFSRLAGAQFTVCMICFTLQTFLFCFPQTIAFSPHHLYLTLNTSEHTLLLCFMHL